MRKIRQWQLGMISVGMWSSDCLRGGHGDGGRITEKGDEAAKLGAAGA